jgi:hypothetical protein
MKKFLSPIKITLSALLLLLVNSCVDYDDNLRYMGEQVTVDESPNDPKEQGLVEACDGIPESPEIFTELVINPGLPSTVDLSPMIPPVRSQGGQGSCVAWATTYYMKSYMEKKQHGYDYADYSTVMSPAFVFNQIKVSCSLGSCIENALYLLKTKGTSTWLDFPYDQGNCSLLPPSSQFTLALTHKNARSFIIGPETTIEGQIYSRLDIIKNLIFLENPVIIAMKTDLNFAHAAPRNNDNVYIYNSYDMAQDYGNHAMLIVGYDDDLQAFKVVNSWGSAWGNEGYCWISYNFFKSFPDPDFQFGVLGTYTAYDQL